jgi:hypothetical protein
MPIEMAMSKGRTSELAAALIPSNAEDVLGQVGREHDKVERGGAKKKVLLHANGLESIHRS